MRHGTKRKAAFPGEALTNAHVDFAFDCGLMQGCVVPVVAGIWVCSLAQQQANHLSVAERAGIVQRDQPTVVAGVHIGARLQEVLHHVLPAKPWRIRDRETNGDFRKQTQSSRLYQKQTRGVPNNTPILPQIAQHHFYFKKLSHTSTKTSSLKC